MADYINIDVGYAIKPAQTNITLGDVVCFSSPVVTASGEEKKSYGGPYSKFFHMGTIIIKVVMSLIIW